MEKRYKEIDFGCGCSIKEAVKQLIKCAMKDEFVCGEFNGHMLYSDTVSMDSAYLEITGKTYSEFMAMQQSWLEKHRKEEREHREKIPQLTSYWIREGHKILSEDKWESWDEIVPIRLNDLYQGEELCQCLDVIVKLKENKFQEAKELMENQGHSGCSFGLMKSMLKSFADNGEEFVLFLDN